MKKVFYRKLIRYKIPEVMRAKGKQFSVHPLSQKEFETELLKKVGEEASALPVVKTKAELIDELADVMDVIDEIKHVKKISTKMIAAKQKEHQKTKGGFAKKYFLEWSEKDDYKTNERLGKKTRRG